ncbi:hypothetical protein KC853_01415, partial [Candidatus Saccharibacteria bacterium]|nr:hypothetical protein [Candidatus Saccharibacteria bacterium]
FPAFGAGGGGLEWEVMAFNSDLLAAGSGINKETVNAHREAYLRVADITGILSTSHGLVAHSLGGFTAAAGPLANIGQNEDNGHQHTQVDKAILLAPASVTPESYLSEAWKDWSWTLDLATRVASFRAHERSWERHRTNLAKSFFKTLLTEAKKGRKDPQVVLAGLGIAYEMRKLNRVPDAFATLANVSVVPEIVNAIKHGVAVSIVSGDQDQLFPIGQLTEAISLGKERTNLNARVPVVEVWGNGHSSLGTDAGHNILNLLAFILRGQPIDGIVDGLYINNQTPPYTWREVPTEL